MAKNYVPTRDADFDGWFTLLNQYVTDKCGGEPPAWNHIPQASRTELLNAGSAWHAGYSLTLKPCTPPGKGRFLLENIYPGRLEDLLPCSPDTGLCMDTGHLLLEDRDPADYFHRYGDRIGEIHLHSMDREKAAQDGRLPDHRPLREEEPWLERLLPCLESYAGVVNLEVFSWEEAAQSIGVLQRAGLGPPRK